MNVLITGGNGRMARHIESTDKITFLKPNRQELDLASLDSIDNYLNTHTVDGILLNAVHYPPGKIDLNNFRGQAESFFNATKVNLVATIYIYKKLQEVTKKSEKNLMVKQT